MDLHFAESKSFVRSWYYNINVSPNQRRSAGNNFALDVLEAMQAAALRIAVAVVSQTVSDSDLKVVKSVSAAVPSIDYKQVNNLNRIEKVHSPPRICLPIGMATRCVIWV